MLYPFRSVFRHALDRHAVLILAIAFVVSLVVPIRAQAQPEVVTVRAVMERESVRVGEQTALAVVIDHAPGWHVHTNNPKVPRSWGSDFVAIPTQVIVNAPAGVRVGPTQWPRTHTIKIDLAGTGKPEPYEVFDGEAIMIVPLLISQDARDELTIAVTVSYQACDDKQCLQPDEKTFDIKLVVGAESGAEIEPRLFAGFDRSIFASADSWSAPAQATGPSSAPRSFFGIPLPREGGAMSVLLLLILSIAGGVILNLTPCVLPVIPLKVMTLSQHAGSPGRMLYLGLWMAAGVVVFWLGVGVPVLLFSSFQDPSRIFAIWWITFGLGVLIAIMALGLMGMFNLQLPQGMYMLNPKADTAWGSFLFGIMTAVLGLPCFGFVAGALLAAAATLPKLLTLVIFLGLGVGMALPYLLLAWKPGWIERIPRSGPASDLVKQVLGLLLLAAGAYFIGSGLIGLVAGSPYMGKVLHLWAVAIFALLAGQWLLVRTYQISRSFVKRVVFTVVALVLGVGSVTIAWDATERAKYDRWVAYSPEAFEAARASGKVVVVDFTANWCINCQALKASVLSREPAASELYAEDVVLMTVDYSGKNPVGQAFQDSLGQTGIPLLGVFPPGQGEPWFSNSYTGSQVVEAIQRARSGSGSLASTP